MGAHASSDLAPIVGDEFHLVSARAGSSSRLAEAACSSRGGFDARSLDPVAEVSCSFSSRRSRPSARSSFFLDASLMKKVKAVKGGAKGLMELRKKDGLSEKKIPWSKIKFNSKNMETSSYPWVSDLGLPFISLSIFFKILKKGVKFGIAMLIAIKLLVKKFKKLLRVFKTLAKVAGGIGAGFGLIGKVLGKLPSLPKLAFGLALLPIFGIKALVKLIKKLPLPNLGLTKLPKIPGLSKLPSFGPVGLALMFPAFLIGMRKAPFAAPAMIALLLRMGLPSLPSAALAVVAMPIVLLFMIMSGYRFRMGLGHPGLPGLRPSITSLPSNQMAGVLAHLPYFAQLQAASPRAFPDWAVNPGKLPYDEPRPRVFRDDPGFARATMTNYNFENGVRLPSDSTLKFVATKLRGKLLWSKKASAKSMFFDACQDHSCRWPARGIQARNSFLDISCHPRPVAVHDFL
eukprot:TRINITY_DN39238_c0_g1_i1.p1 TRINITY_DN39238_c0_g1~~TRINITY_DN39238_c0_g1_i1.p1  ORF type:complete len:459 (+),score=70.26 TRINITY_DN39238_c0_g1_i1:74-1450(+)